MDVTFYRFCALLFRVEAAPFWKSFSIHQTDTIFSFPSRMETQPTLTLIGRVDALSPSLFFFCLNSRINDMLSQNQHSILEYSKWVTDSIHFMVKWSKYPYCFSATMWHVLCAIECSHWCEYAWNSVLIRISKFDVQIYLAAVWYVPRSIVQTHILIKIYF